MKSTLRSDLHMGLLAEYDADGFLGIGLDGYGEEKSGLAPAEAHHPLGLIARPRDPDLDSTGQPKLGVTVLRLIEENAEHAIVLGDPRATAKLPRLKKGGVCLYADTGKAVLPFQVFDGDNGSWQLYVPYGDPATAMTIAVDVSTAGAESIQVVHGSGMGLTFTAGGKNAIVLHNKAGDAFLVIDDDGIKLNAANLATIGTATLGAQASPSDPVPQAIALAPPLQAAWTALQTFLTQVMAGVNGLAPGSITAPVPALPGTVAATKGNAA